MLTLDQISGLLESIKEKDVKENVRDFFMIHVKEYLDVINKINNSLLEEKAPTEEIREKLYYINDFIMQKAYDLEGNISNLLYTKKIKETFRKLVTGWSNKGLIVKHGLEKPKGYPGDYELLEIIYNNKPISKGIGFYYDKYLLDNEYAIGVRERKNQSKNIIKDYILSSEKKKINILNLACGSCRELRELFIDDGFNTTKDLNIQCLDQDKDALKFSKNILKNLPRNLTFSFLQDDIIKLALGKSKLDGRFDLIYNIGLADYLPDRILRNFIEFCLKRLMPSGKFVLAHKDIEKHKPLQPDWFCNWNFYPRNENKLLELIKSVGTDGFSIEKEYLKPSCIFFITLTKIAALQ